MSGKLLRNVHEKISRRGKVVEMSDSIQRAFRRYRDEASERQGLPLGDPEPKMPFNAITNAFSQRPVLGGEGEPLAPARPFRTGIKSGIRYGYEAFLSDSDKLDWERRRAAERGPIRMFAGDVVGMGIGFVPYILAGKAIVPARLGVAALGATGTRTLQYGVAGAGFEAGGTTELEDLPTNMAIGAAYGAGGEVLFRGAQKINHWRKGRKLREDVPVGRTGPHGVKETVHIHPDDLTIEAALNPTPGNTREQGLQKLAALGSAEDRLDVLVAGLRENDHPLGLRVIPGISDPKRLTREIKKRDSSLQVARHERPDGTWDFLVVSGQTPRLVALANDVEKGRLTAKQILDEINGSTYEGTTLHAEVTDIPGAAGMADDAINKMYVAPEETFRKLFSDPEAHRLDTTLHEYAHLLHFVRARTRGTPILDEGSCLCNS
jgi:hypothetical protein